MGKFAGKGKRVSAIAKAVGEATRAQPKGDEFKPGKYRVRFVDCSESDTGSLCVKLAGVGDNEEIGERIQWFSTSGKSLRVSAPRLKGMCMALVGIDDDEEYAEFDPHREFVNAILPYDVDAAAAYLVEAGKAKNAKAATALLAAAEFTIKVTKGSPKDDGGFFRDATFSLEDSGADSDDDSDDDDDDDSDDEPESERKPARKAKAAAKRKPSRDEDEEDDDDADSDDDSDDDEEDDEPESEPAPRKGKKAKAKAKGRK